MEKSTSTICFNTVIYDKLCHSCSNHPLKYNIQVCWKSLITLPNSSWSVKPTCFCNGIKVQGCDYKHIGSSTPTGQEKSQTDQSSDLGGQGMSPKHEIRRQGTDSWQLLYMHWQCAMLQHPVENKHFYYFFAVSTVWQKKCNQHMNITCRVYCHCYAVFLKKYGPITPKLATAHQIVTRREWRGLSQIMQGC